MTSWLREVDTHAVIDAHAIAVNPRWWNQQLTRQNFIDPLLGATLTRADLFGLADGARQSPEGALTLLWNSLAWGSGTRNRNNKRRIDAIATNREEHGQLLQDAAQLSTTDPVRAYQLLRPRRHNTISSLGPAFFTKYLYFAGGGDPHHPCCILDNLVARSLRHAGYSDIADANWSAQTYRHYIELIERWRIETGAPRNDLIERWLFDSAGTGGQP